MILLLLLFLPQAFGWTPTIFQMHLPGCTTGRLSSTESRFWTVYCLLLNLQTHRSHNDSLPSNWFNLLRSTLDLLYHEHVHYPWYYRHFLLVARRGFRPHSSSNRWHATTLFGDIHLLIFLLLGQSFSRSSERNFYHRPNRLGKGTSRNYWEKMNLNYFLFI